MAATSKPSPAHSSKEDSHHDSVEKDNLPTRQEKEAAAKKQQEHEQLPDRVAEMEDALCEQDAANEKRLTDIETALCELDAALNKE